MLQRLLVISILLLFSSCATIEYSKTLDGRMESLLGKDYQQAILVFGPPTDIYSDSNDGRILHYDYSTERTVPAMSYTVGNFDGNIWATSLTRPPQTIRDERFVQVYVRPDSTIYHYRYRKMQTQAEEKMHKTNHTLSAIYWTAGITGVLAAILAASE